MNNHVIFLMAVTVLLYVSTGYAASAMESGLAGDGAPQCGIENCHGMDITCGENIAEICSAMGGAGDFCRAYVSCAVVEGKCQVVEDPLFIECRACVQQCESDHPDDPIAAFNCDTRCREALEGTTDPISFPGENGNEGTGNQYK